MWQIIFRKWHSHNSDCWTISVVSSSMRLSYTKMTTMNSHQGHGHHTTTIIPDNKGLDRREPLVFFFLIFFLLFECFRLCIAHSRLINSNVNTCPWPLLPLSSPWRTIYIYWNRNCKWPSTPHTWMNVAREMSPICHFMGFLLHLTQGPRHNLDTTTNTSDNGWQIQFAMDMFF